MNDIRICFFGDSFTHGVGDPEHRGWVGRLKFSDQEKTELTLYNLGIRRNTSEDIKQRWQSEAQLRFPEQSDNRLVFSFGVNDTVLEDGQFRISENTSISNTREILRKARSSYKTIMIGPPPIDDDKQNQRIHSLDMALHHICVELEIPYLSIFEDLADDPIWMNEVAKQDGAHPQAEGYAKLASLVENWHSWWFNK